MAQTKAIDIINKSLSIIGVKPAGVDLTDQEIDDSISSLNIMMTALDAEGLRLGFSIVEDKDDLITSPDWSFGMIIYSLAIMIAPEYSKQPDQALLISAARFESIVRNRVVSISQPSLPSSLPTGSGHNQGCGRNYRNFFPDADANNLKFGNGQNMQDDEGQQLLLEDTDESL